MPTGEEKRVPVDSENIRPRLYALPGRSDDEPAATTAREEVDSAATIGADGTLKVGSKVIAGTVLARIGAGEDGIDPHINFSIRPAGRGAPRIDPKPILDGWKLLEATAIYRAKGKSPFAAKLSGAGVLLLSKEALQRRVLADEQHRAARMRPGRNPRRADRPAPAGGARLPLRAGLPPDDHLDALRTHGSITTSGNISNHSFGNAVDIAMINGVPGARPPGPRLDHRSAAADRAAPAGHAAPGRADLAAGTSAGRASRWPTTPTTSTSATARSAAAGEAAASSQLLKPDQWQRLIDRLGEIENPEVPTAPSDVCAAGQAARRAATQEVGRHCQRRLSHPGESGPLTQLFGFAQFEFPARSASPTAATWPGRRRGRREQRVLVVETLGAPPPRRAGAGAARSRPSRRAGRRSCRSPGRPRCAPPSPSTSEEEAQRWLRRRPPPTRRPSTRSSRRGSPCSTAPSTPRPPPSGDPLPRQLTPARAVAVRIGYGSGEEVAAGRFTARPRRSTSRPPAARAAGGASEELRPAGARRGRAGRPRADRRLRDAAAARPRRPRRRSRRARPPCSSGSGSRRCWSSSTARWSTPATSEDMAELEERRKAVGAAANAALARRPRAPSGPQRRSEASCSRDRASAILRRRRVLRGG